MSVNRLKGMDQHMEEPGRPMVMPVREVEPHRWRLRWHRGGRPKGCEVP